MWQYCESRGSAVDHVALLLIMWQCCEQPPDSAVDHVTMLWIHQQQCNIMSTALSCHWQQCHVISAVLSHHQQYYCIISTAMSPHIERSSTSNKQQCHTIYSTITWVRARQYIIAAFWITTYSRPPGPLQSPHSLKLKTRPTRVYAEYNSVLHCKGCVRLRRSNIFACFKFHPKIDYITAPLETKKNK
jgi:hypothetical protein